eukprot:scaffold14784_cov123-Isochrysis_galbana.AAC.4
MSQFCRKQTGKARIKASAAASLQHICPRNVPLTRPADNHCISDGTAAAMAAMATSPWLEIGRTASPRRRPWFSYASLSLTGSSFSAIAPAGTAGTDDRSGQAGAQPPLPGCLNLVRGVRRRDVATRPGWPSRVCVAAASVGSPTTGSGSDSSGGAAEKDGGGGTLERRPQRQALQCIGRLSSGRCAPSSQQSAV